MTLRPVPVPPTVEWLEHIENALTALDDVNLAMMGMTNIYNRTDENHSFYDKKFDEALDYDSFKKRKDTLSMRRGALAEEVHLAQKQGYDPREVTIELFSLAKLVRDTVKRFEEQVAAA